jgi:hypothetical protein
MADPITPNFEYGLIDGQTVVAWIALTSTGSTTVETVNLSSYYPWIDIRVGHPVITGWFISNETDCTGTEALLPSKEMERGTAPDSTGEWQITDHNTITFYKTADQNGHVGICYIAFGGQRA